MASQAQAVPPVEVPRPKALFVEPKVHRAFKYHVLNYAHGMTMQQAAEEAVNEWLARQQRENGNG